MVHGPWSLTTTVDRTNEREESKSAQEVNHRRFGGQKQAAAGGRPSIPTGI
jgi:hypothetical protein